ncbi:hypothetical protein, partial [Pseudomonas aeruginosa]|uniref:hypothetical protein n=1 Tax=Pseudomonas aeruginosa TaxID=287 RepID=UPI001ABC2BD6
TSEVSARELTIKALVANIPDLMLWRFAGAARVASRLAWRHRRTTQLGIPIRECNQKLAGNQQIVLRLHLMT